MNMTYATTELHLRSSIESKKELAKKAYKEWQDANKLMENVYIEYLSSLCNTKLLRVYKRAVKENDQARKVFEYVAARWAIRCIAEEEKQ